MSGQLCKETRRVYGALRHDFGSAPPDISEMPLYACPGELVAHVCCRKCGRSVQFDPRGIPPAPLTERDRRRFWCMKCGGRGADVTIGWTIPRSGLATTNVVLGA